jgi:integrase
MLSLRKRGRVYWLEARIANRRIQTTLGTRNGDAATLAKNRVERALTEGASSQEWPLLQGLIPETVFLNLAAIVGYVTQPQTRPHTWVDLKAAFTAEAERRIVLAKLRASTWIRYKYTLSEFTEFLSSVGVSELTPISRVVIEHFKAWRAARIKQKRHSREARGVALDAAILHRVFSYGLELEMIARNPVRMEGRLGDAPECGAQPFKADELSKLRAAAGLDFLAFLVLGWTGLRGSDVVTLRWAEIDFHTGEIGRLTLKRRKRVVIPMHSELKFALEADFQQRSPSPEDRVLLNPATSKPMTRPRLYARIDSRLGSAPESRTRPRIASGTHSAWTCWHVASSPTLSRNSWASRSRCWSGTTRHSFRNCESVSGACWIAAKVWKDRRSERQIPHGKRP